MRTLTPTLLLTPSVLALTLAAAPVGAQEDAGFLISIGGAPVVGDAAVADLARRTDVARANADVRVTADGLGVSPRLDLAVLDTGGGQARVQSRVNYPAFVTRAELRIYQRDASGQLVLTGTTPIAPNGAAVVAVPGAGAAVVHRVYDAAGRFDETVAIALDRVSGGGAVEIGADRTARRAIPVVGGAITVSGSGLAPGATVQTMGETFPADPSGAFVLQRIVPPGERQVPVRVTGAGRPLLIEPTVTIPASEWFYVGTVDLTYGRNLHGPLKGTDYTEGRLAFYAKGKTATGWTITASADTGEAPIEDLFRDILKKDPRNLLMRLDEDMAYPTYGDDSTAVVDAPTNGKFYLRADRDGSHVMWGNYTALLDTGTYLRNERTLYGFQGLYASPARTSRGEARVKVTGYAAQPDMLPAREVFRGTGGSVYFLAEQDIAPASETLTVEVRDKDTGRVLSQRVLVAGRDYQINYLQGIITLSAPLSGLVGSDLLRPAPGEGAETRLIAQYEFTPTAGTIDGYSYGARGEAWVTDRLRLGVTGMVEQTGVADQTATGADLRYVFGQNSFVALDYARTEGPGFGSSYSSDGGLVISRPTTPRGGTGEAYRFETEIDLADLGMAAEGGVSAYYERRGAGFDTLDYQVTATETLWGIAADIDPDGPLSYRIGYDAFEDTTGKRVNEGRAELGVALSDRVTLRFGAAHVDKVTLGEPDETGRRTDLAAELAFVASDRLTWRVFAQSTLDRVGGLDRNDRIGLGVLYGFAEGWSFDGELSQGTSGTGARILFRQETASGNAYAGYTLDPGRELDGVTLNGRDKGQFVAGGRRRVSDRVSIYGENTYDMFGERSSLTSAYGVDYDVSQALSVSGAVEIGQVKGDGDDYDRNALSFGLRYDDETRGLTGSGRLELRRDRGTTGGANRDSDTVLFSFDGQYRVSEAARVILTLDHARTTTSGTAVQPGDYTKATLGYAYRPVDDDRLNLLLRYTYLDDMYGQVVNGTAGPVQTSHVFSIDASYDVSQTWTLGGKLGFRLSESAPDATTPLQRNDALLAVANARYHLTHEWDILLEGRYLDARQAGLTDTSLLGAVYRQVGPNWMVGLGYNFGNLSDDLTDLTEDDGGIFLNVIAQF